MKTDANKPVITICASCHFYRQAVDVQEQLQKLGYEVVVPSLATAMKESGDFEVSHYKTWYGDANDYHKKAQLMHGHFDKITDGDAILVLNYEKHGKQNYIGPNVLMEMALAFHQNKPIFVINELPDDTPFEEELKGIGAIVLSGELTNLPKEHAKIAKTKPKAKAKTEAKPKKK